MNKLILLALCAISLCSASDNGAAEPRLIEKFRIDQSKNIMRPENFGVANGKITTGIACDDLFAIKGIWAPPYVSSDFSFEVAIDGMSASQPAFQWSPYYIERSASLEGGVLARADTVLIPEGRAFVFALELENTGGEERSLPVEIGVEGSLDTMLSDASWGFSAPQSSSAAVIASVGENMATFAQGEAAIAIAASESLAWDNAQRRFTGTLSVPPHGKMSIHVGFAIGASGDAVKQCGELAADPEGAIARAYSEYDRRVADLYDKMPRLESDNAALVQFYDRSLIPFLMNRWDVPEFKLKPFYATGSVRGGCVGDYLWNVGECLEILSFFDPVATKAHIRQFLETGIGTGFGFCPINGEMLHRDYYYPINQEKLIGLAFNYVRNTGDAAFLDEKIGDRTMLQAIVDEALYLDDVSKPVALIDYNICDPQNSGGRSHLELRTPIGELNYTNVMPDLNGRRYLNYVLAARLSEVAGKARPDLLERAEALKIALKKELWDGDKKWFVYKMPDADPPYVGHRYTVQMFYLLGSGVLDEEQESGLLSHLNEKEFLSDYGLHSLAKHDPAYLQEDVDNGGPGACTCFPLNIAKTLYVMDKPAFADDILKRILWWGERMPYWGDSFYADTVRYREETPLQSTIDAVTGAQCIIYGMFGIRPEFDGSIVIKPNMPSFARQVSLSGVTLRNVLFDVALRDGAYTVACQGKSVNAKIGQSVIISQGNLAVKE